LRFNAYQVTFDNFIPTKLKKTSEGTKFCIFKLF